MRPLVRKRGGHAEYSTSSEKRMRFLARLSYTDLDDPSGCRKTSVAAQVFTLLLALIASTFFVSGFSNLNFYREQSKRLHGTAVATPDSPTAASDRALPVVSESSFPSDRRTRVEEVITYTEGLLGKSYIQPTQEEKLIEPKQYSSQGNATTEPTTSINFDPEQKEHQDITTDGESYGQVTRKGCHSYRNSHASSINGPLSASTCQMCYEACSKTDTCEYYSWDAGPVFPTWANRCSRELIEPEQYSSQENATTEPTPSINSDPEQKEHQGCYSYSQPSTEIGPLSASTCQRCYDACSKTQECRYYSWDGGPILPTWANRCSKELIDLDNDSQVKTATDEDQGLEAGLCNVGCTKCQHNCKLLWWWCSPTCAACDEPAHMLSSGRCMCGTGYAEMAGSCTACPSGCGGCGRQSPKWCDWCSTGNLWQGQCIDTCPDGFFSNIGVCIAEPGQPALNPTPNPTPKPSAPPTTEPSPAPTPLPTVHPTITSDPKPEPTARPTQKTEPTSPSPTPASATLATRETILAPSPNPNSLASIHEPKVAQR